ncbi:MAG TPA: glycosyltransferase [Conexibacter sp.]|jgi:glycosyltransferase involved in cell wall biosynthesis|nr:glycosyltransferase [Conexibacter sp.]
MDSPAPPAPRVTLGIATYDRDTYLAEAIASGLGQAYDDFELLVVCDGSRNPAIDAVLDGFAGDPRLRVVRHTENRGIAAAYDTIWREGRGELIAMLGDDDVCLPDRLARQAAIFDRHPDTGVVHGDALVIDGAGAVTGRWDSRDFTPAELVHAFFRSHNHLVDPTRMVHRRVYEAVGGYDGSYPIAQDLHFWLRAARDFRFRHVPGGPLTGFRRHGANTSDESARAQEIADVERALEMALDLYPLRELVPELDWDVLDARDAECQAWLRLADALQRRRLPLPALAARVRERAAALPAPAPRRLRGAGARRLLMTAFGWNDAGGGTLVPRLAAKELARRGWDVTVFHAAVTQLPDAGPYHVAEWEEDGVRLLGVHNRRHGLWDRLDPLRELDDPPITAAYAAALDRLRPDVVHFHNLHNLGAALIDATAARGIPSYFTTHNYWLVCPRAYLQTGEAAICAGPGDGARCATCVGGRDPDGHRRRFEQIRARVARGVTAVLAVSDAVRETLAACGYPPEMLDVVRQGMPHDGTIWEQLGRDRVPGRAGGPGAPLTVAFVGSAYPHKGPQLLVEAAQLVAAPLRVQVHGELPDAFRDELLARDARGVVELCGAFRPSEMARVLAGVDVAALPSVWWDCAPLVAAECRAGRVPLLVPRLGGLAEAVRDGVDGLAFDALSVDGLAAALSRVATEPGLLERLQAGIAPPRAFAAYVDELEAHYAGERPGHERAVAQPSRADGGVTASEPQEPHAADGGAASIERLAVLWRGDVPPPPLPCRVQHLAPPHAADPPLPHVAHVEVRTSWPPDQRPAAAGRLVLAQPAGAAPPDGPLADGVQPALGVAPGPLADCVDELWVPGEPAREAALAAGCDAARVRVLDLADGDGVAARLAALAARPPRAADPAFAPPRELEEDAELRVLATPAWRAVPGTGDPDPLAELLAQWCAATTPASSTCLYLLADPAADGTAQELEARVLAAAAAAGVDLEACADINLMVEPLTAERDARLHAAIPLYVPLHPACAGHERLARATGGEIVPLAGDGLARRLRTAIRTVPAPA